MTKNNQNTKTGKTGKTVYWFRRLIDKFPEKRLLFSFYALLVNESTYNFYKDFREEIWNSNKSTEL